MPHGDNHIVWINPRNPKIIARRGRRRRRPFRSTAATPGAAYTISRPDSSITSRSTISFRSTFTARVKTKARSKAPAPPSARASAPASGIPSRWARARSSHRTPTTSTSRTAAAITARSRASTASPATRRTSVLGRDTWPARHRRETKYRFGWTHPIFFSPADPRELLVAAQVVFSSTDKGQTWKIISPDLTRNDPTTEGPSGGPVYLRSNRRRDVSRHLIACRFAARCQRTVGGLRRRTRARDDRSRRALDARDAAAASAMGADQFDRTVPHAKRHGLSHGIALYVGRLPSLPLRDDGLRRALDDADERIALRPIRLSSCARIRASRACSSPARAARCT